MVHWRCGHSREVDLRAAGDFYCRRIRHPDIRGVRPVDMFNGLIHWFLSVAPKIFFWNFFEGCKYLAQGRIKYSKTITKIYQSSPFSSFVVAMY